MWGKRGGKGRYTGAMRRKKRSFRLLCCEDPIADRRMMRTRAHAQGAAIWEVLLPHAMRRAAPRATYGYACALRTAHLGGEPAPWLDRRCPPPHAPCW